MHHNTVPQFNPHKQPPTLRIPGPDADPRAAEEIVEANVGEREPEAVDATLERVSARCEGRVEGDDAHALEAGAAGLLVFGEREMGGEGREGERAGGAAELEVFGGRATKLTGKSIWK